MVVGMYGPQGIFLESGAPAASTSVTVLEPDTQVPAALFDATGSTSGNPVTTDAYGNLSFFAEVGFYDLLINEAVFRVQVSGGGGGGGDIVYGGPSDHVSYHTNSVFEGGFYNPSEYIDGVYPSASLYGLLPSLEEVPFELPAGLQEDPLATSSPLTAVRFKKSGLYQVSVDLNVHTDTFPKPAIYAYASLMILRSNPNLDQGSYGLLGQEVRYDADSDWAPISPAVAVLPLHTDDVIWMQIHSQDDFSGPDKLVSVANVTITPYIRNA